MMGNRRNDVFRFILGLLTISVRSPTCKGTAVRTEVPKLPDEMEWTPASLASSTCRPSNVGTTRGEHSYFRVCDPDGTLNEEGVENIENSILGLETAEKLKLKCKGNESGSSLQMAVVIIRQMNLTEWKWKGSDAVDIGAKNFAINIHDTWGVGSEDCGGTGILMFLSINDRAIFISTGGGVKKILTPNRLDDVIDTMKPALQRYQYAHAIIDGIESINKYMEVGEPGFFEKYSFLLTLLGFGTLWSALQFIEERRKREYARVHSHLSRIDRDRALALMGQYECTSCPICLEDFKIVNDVTPPPPGYDQLSAEDDNGGNSTRNYVGSDGKPLKLLRCGHAFDQTCWNDWVTTGSDVENCPICKQDIGISTALTSSSNREQQQQQSNELIGTGNDRNSGEIQERARYYDRERNFRLIRLMNRYPRYVNRSLVNRWSRPGYDGRLAQDNGFVRNDPSRVYNNNAAGSRNTSFRSSGFGGGRSAGGRGGRW